MTARPIVGVDHTRADGARVGLLVAGAFVIVDALAGWRIFSFLLSVDGPIGPITAIPVVVAGGTAGWLAGRRAAAAQTLGSWVRVTLLAGVCADVAWLATLAGAAGLIGGISADWGAGLALLGALVLVLFALPYALVGAAIWAVLMRRGRSS